MDDLIVVKTFVTRLEAEIAKSFLESRNIQTLIMADDAGGVYPSPFKPTTSSVKLLINKRDYKEAIKELNEKNLKL